MNNIYCIILEVDINIISKVIFINGMSIDSIPLVYSKIFRPKYLIHSVFILAWS